MLPRHDRALHAVRAVGAEAFLAAHPSTVAWLTGYAPVIHAGPSPFAMPPVALLNSDGVDLVVSADEAPAVAEHVRVTTYEGYSLGQIDPAGRARAALEPLVTGRRLVGETSYLPVVLRPDSGIMEADALLDGARMVKDPDELQQLSVAVAVSLSGQQATEEHARAGITELELWGTVRAAMEDAAGGPVPLVADFISGPRTAGVEGAPTTRTLANGDPLISDLVPRVGAYWGDTCATVTVGDAPPEVTATYKVVADRLRRAIDAVRPGLTAGDLDALMRDGLDYPHHSGHGLGTGFHEQPRLVPGNPVVLRPGMVIALEPAFYADHFGVRLEQVVVVTTQGCELLPHYPCPPQPLPDRSGQG